jgi:hypothetical protein
MKDLKIMVEGKPLEIDERNVIDIEMQNPLLSDKPIYSSSVW